MPSSHRELVDRGQDCVSPSSRELRSFGPRVSFTYSAQALASLGPPNAPQDVIRRLTNGPVRRML